jgi:hypothetical protein
MTKRLTAADLAMMQAKTTILPRYYIGIDPGVHTGIAVWYRPGARFMLVGSRTIIEAMQLINDLAANHGREMIFLRIEDARLVKLPKHLRGEGREQGAGSVKRDSAIWEEFAKHYGYQYTMLNPISAPKVIGGEYLDKANEEKRRAGLIKSPKGKECTGESFNKVTGWNAKTTGHARDAAMLVWGM